MPFNHVIISLAAGPRGSWSSAPANVPLVFILTNSLQCLEQECSKYVVGIPIVHRSCTCVMTVCLTALLQQPLAEVEEVTAALQNGEV